MFDVRRWFRSNSARDMRRHKRSATPPIVAYFWDGGQPVAHTIKDVSPVGFYLYTEDHWPLGTLMRMTLRRTYAGSGHAECSVTVLSKVVRYGWDGVGFAFIPVDTADSGPQSTAGVRYADRTTLGRFIRLLDEDSGDSV